MHCIYEWSWLPPWALYLHGCIPASREEMDCPGGTLQLGSLQPSIIETPSLWAEWLWWCLCQCQPLFGAWCEPQVWGCFQQLLKIYLRFIKESCSWIKYVVQLSGHGRVGIDNEWGLGCVWCFLGEDPKQGRDRIRLTGMVTFIECLPWLDPVLKALGGLFSLKPHGNPQN